MNVRKPTDYSAMYGILDQLMGAELPQMELYFAIGRAVCVSATTTRIVPGNGELQSR